MSNKISVILFLCLIIWKENIVEADSKALISIEGRLSGNKKFEALDGFHGTWLEAMLECKANNMELYSIDSKDDNAAVFTYLRTRFGNTTAGFWTSGYYSSSKQWVWMTTGKEVVYTNWEDDQPDNVDDENKEVIEATYKYDKGLLWNDRAMSEKLGVLCEEIKCKNNDTDTKN
ncbi:alpha-N-acetylgalactosamine-specific lectin [Diabrotica virgifera virgifera]|uniref:Alpha-N-acetylgalactosamine-specific lectin-like n=1 Tax=Diabrotica virgifera virgifera TaxID=50390 RepID=A0A6P7F3C5_DIAVI|nr:alpha-N-acetylgalactosamine-specific lectin [Diabrotica virgifera virgifera]